jgi:hypothetical protein
MSIGELQNQHDIPIFPYQKLGGWLFLLGSIPMLVWVFLAGVIAVPHPSFLSLYGGPAIACFMVGIGLIANSPRLLWGALAVLLLGFLGWFLLP